MPFEKISLSNFVKGVSAAFGRLAQPRGSMARLSNLAFFRNENGIGSLVTLGGSRIISALASGGAQAPFYYIAALSPDGITPDNYAIQVTAGGGTGTNIVKVTGATWGPAVTNVNAQTAFKIPQAFMFQNKLVILTGLNSTPVLWDGATITPIANAWTAVGFVPTWLASTAEAVGSFVQPTVSNGHFYQCIQGGTTGSAQPTFPTGSGATVTDGPVIWQEAGVTTANVPNGAHGAYHQGALWLWGTAAADGPQFGLSGLSASDVGNPNSWNPANQTFVAQGDGQSAQGCAVMSVEEVGISPEARLVLFKNFSVYEFLGNFPNFSLVAAKTDMGCQAPRTIKYSTQLGGLIRFTDRGFALYQGPGAQADNIISQDISPYIFGNVPGGITGIDLANASLSQAAITKHHYFCAMPVAGGTGALTRIFALDLTLKVWAVCDLPTGLAITSLNDIRDFFGSGTFVLASQSTGTGPTVLDVLNAGENEWVYQGGQAEIAFSGRTPLIVDPKKPQRVFYTRNVLIGGTSPSPALGGSTLGLGRITSASLIYSNPATGSDNAKNGAGRPNQSGSGNLQILTLPIPKAGLSLPARINIGIKTRGFQLVFGGKGVVTVESFDFETKPGEERPYAQI